jgi:hypothetical protein
MHSRLSKEVIILIGIIGGLEMEGITERLILELLALVAIAQTIVLDGKTVATAAVKLNI